MSQPSPTDDFDDDEEDQTSIRPVGKIKYLNIADTPCYRDTLLYSITAALATGLTKFMVTSNVNRSLSTALVTMSATMLLYYSFCRHRLVSDKIKFLRVKQNLRQYVDQKGKMIEEDED